MARGERGESAVPTREAAVRTQRWQTLVTWLLVFFAIALVVDGVAGEKGLLANRRAAEELRREEAALAAANARNEMLRREVKRLKQDATALEELARKTQGLVKPGEKLFIVKDVEPSKAK